MNSCPLCQKHKSNSNHYISKTKNFIIYHGPIESNILGYIFIESLRHIEYWSQLDLEEQQELTQLITKVEMILLNELNIERMYTVSIAEAVRHFHLHLIPRELTTSTKGLPLIKQATQQAVPLNQEAIDKESVYNLITVMKKKIK
jgi:diadenosine tetraphosphate (Ap4A) HIT family hydrolase